jgi:soluble lytic murein transglycosylase-like protein
VRADGTRVLVNDPPRTRSVPAPRPKNETGKKDPYIDRLIEDYARAHGLEVGLVRAVIHVESAFDPRARSRKGAMGLMQLMPDTARELGVHNAWDPAQNISGGTRYLRRLWDRFGSLELALAGYNAGPSVVEKYGKIPPFPETTEYVRRVLRLYRGGAPGGAELARSSGGRPIEMRRDSNNHVWLVN